MNKNGKITVLGSFVVDLMGRANHLPLPGETVLGSTFKMGPGGKGSNQASAAHRAGGSTAFITKLGTDLFSNVAKDFYREEKMVTDYLLTDEVLPTGTALILVDEKTSQNSIIVIPGACMNITKKDLETVSPALVEASILLCQLETNLDILKPAVETFRNGETPCKTAILNPAPARELPADLISLFDIVTPNEVEASILTGVEVTDFKTAEKAADVFLKMGIQTAVITMGSRGLLIKNKDVEIIPPFEVNALDTTGAGDAFNGGFAAALSWGWPISDAARFGAATAALSVTKIGTAPAMPYKAEIEELLAK